MSESALYKDWNGLTHSAHLVCISHSTWWCPLFCRSRGCVEIKNGTPSVSRCFLHSEFASGQHGLFRIKTERSTLCMTSGSWPVRDRENNISWGLDTFSFDTTVLQGTYKHPCLNMRMWGLRSESCQVYSINRWQSYTSRPFSLTSIHRFLPFVPCYKRETRKHFAYHLATSPAMFIWSLAQGVTIDLALPPMESITYKSHFTPLSINFLTYNMSNHPKSLLKFQGWSKKVMS